MKSIRVLTTAIGFIASTVIACGAAPGANGEQGASTDESINELQSTAVPAAASVDQIDFDLFPNAKFAPCFAAWPNDGNRQPAVHVHVSRGELNDTLTLTGRNFKPGLKFDMFTVERTPLNAWAKSDPGFKGFGLAWYQSDLEADGGGGMNTTIRTILLDQIFGVDTDVNVNLEPRNTFHVGFWFNNPQDAVACGFDASKPTPFNGDHKAGPLSMISIPNAKSALGPLCANVDWSVSPARCEP